MSLVSIVQYSKYAAKHCKVPPFYQAPNLYIALKVWNLETNKPWTRSPLLTASYIAVLLHTHYRASTFKWISNNIYANLKPQISETGYPESCCPWHCITVVQCMHCKIFWISQSCSIPAAYGTVKQLALLILSNSHLIVPNSTTREHTPFLTKLYLNKNLSVDILLEWMML